MTPRQILRHTEAGALLCTRIGVRFVEPREGDASRERERAAFCEIGAARAGTLRAGPFELELAVEPDVGAVRCNASLRNASDAALRVEAVVLGFLWSPPPASGYRMLRNGWQSWSVTEALALDAEGDAPFPSGAWLRGMFHAQGDPPADRRGWHESELVTLVAARGASAAAGAGEPACVVGVLERGEGFGCLYVRREERSVRIEVEIRLETPLAPGASRRLETVRVALGSDANRLLEGHAEAHGREAGARTRSPFQAGWCTWYHFFHDVTEDDVRRNLEALTAARDELPVDVVQIDDGWQRAIGDWLETSAKFPRGIAPLAAEIRAAGFVPGLWTAPFLAAPDSHVFEAHPDWLLRAGDAPFRGLHHPAWTREGWIHVLDTSREDVLDHLRTVFGSLVEMGFVYQKLDFLYAEAMAAEARDPRITRAGRLRRGLGAIREACGDDVYLLGCGCPLGAAVGVVDGMRIGPDVAPHWEVTPPRIPGIEGTQPSVRNALRNVLARAWMHRRLWQNDPDCLMARSRDTGLAPAEARTLAHAIAATGGAAVFSDDVASLSAADRQLVRETLQHARRADAAAPAAGPRVLGLLEPGAAHGAAASVPGGALLALVDAGDAPELRSADLAGLGWKVPLRVVDGADGSDTAATREGARASGRIERQLAPHSSALLEVEARPALVVFCDFDGTFSVQDVGSTLAQRHAGGRRPQHWARYERGEITAWEYNLEILDGLPVGEEQVDAFLKTVELDPGARALLGWCREREVPFRILSDGFDRNLDRLQEIHGVRFEYDANRLRYEKGAWRIAPSHPDPACNCGTGICKRGRIETWRARHPGLRAVHVGNGRVSDLCGALAADWVFAKGSLAEALEARRVAYQRFDTLRDVVAGLEHLWRGEPLATR